MGIAKFEEDLRLKGNKKEFIHTTQPNIPESYPGCVLYSKPFLLLQFHSKISSKTRKFLVNRGWKYVPSKQMLKKRYSENDRIIAHKLIYTS